MHHHRAKTYRCVLQPHQQQIKQWWHLCWCSVWYVGILYLWWYIYFLYMYLKHMFFKQELLKGKNTVLTVQPYYVFLFILSLSYVLPTNLRLQAPTLSVFLHIKLAYLICTTEFCSSMHNMSHSLNITSGNKLGTVNPNYLKVWVSGRQHPNRAYFFSCVRRLSETGCFQDAKGFALCQPGQYPVNQDASSNNCKHAKR